MKIKQLGSLVLLATATLFAGNASAAYHTLPGSACTSVTGSQVSLHNVIGDTGLTRTGSASGWVTCPLQRTAYVRKTIYVNLSHPAARSTTCKIVRSNYLTGTAKATSSSVTGTGNVYVGLNGSGLGTMETWDVYAVACNIAQGTTIRGVSWEDN